MEYETYCSQCLFPTNGQPDLNDIQQGEVGDCYLLAGLQSLCGTAKGRKAVEDCFINKDTIDKDGKAIIALYMVEVYDENKGQYSKEAGKDYKGTYKGATRVTSTAGTRKKFEIPLKPDIGYAKGGAKWVRLMEEAFKEHRAQKCVKSKLPVETGTVRDTINMWNKNDLNGGMDFIVFTAIKGVDASGIFKNLDVHGNFVGDSSNKNGEHAMDVDTIYNTIKKKLDKGMAVNIAKKSKKGGLHALSVISVYEKSGEKMIKYRNPHGHISKKKLSEFGAKISDFSFERKKKIADGKEVKRNVKMTNALKEEIIKKLKLKMSIIKKGEERYACLFFDRGIRDDEIDGTLEGFDVSMHKFDNDIQAIKDNFNDAVGVQNNPLSIAIDPPKFIENKLNKYNNRYVLKQCWRLEDLEKLDIAGELPDNGEADGSFADMYFLENEEIGTWCTSMGIEFNSDKFPF